MYHQVGRLSVSGRTGAADEAQHRKVCRARVRHHAAENFPPREEAFPDSSAYGGWRSVSYIPSRHTYIC